MNETDENHKDKEPIISWKTCLRVGICLLVVYLCIRYWDVAEQFLILLLSGLASVFAGMVIAYVVNIPMRFFERKLPGPTGDGTRNRTLSMVLSIACIAIIVLFVVLLVVPQLVSAVVTLVMSIPETVTMLASNEFVQSILPSDWIEFLLSIDWGEVVRSVANWLQSGIMSSLSQIMSAISVVLIWFMGIIFALWFLGEKNRLGKQCHRVVKSYLGEAADKKVTRLVATIDDCFGHYIIGQTLEAFIYGAMVAVVSALLGIPNPVVLGVLVGVMSLIPRVGWIIGAILAAIVVLSYSWIQAIVFVIAFIVVMLVESNFVYKRVVGKRTGLTGMWPLIGMTIGASLFGIAGAFVGVPVTAVIFRLVREGMERRENKSVEDAPPLQGEIADAAALDTPESS